MKRLGMKYDYKKKTYYVDGHERADVVAARAAFCKRYLLEYEPRCFRWVHLSKEECDSVPGLSNKLCFEFIAVNGEPSGNFMRTTWIFCIKTKISSHFPRECHFVPLQVLVGLRLMVKMSVYSRNTWWEENLGLEPRANGRCCQRQRVTDT